jgi:hypothetical protein
MQHGEPAPGAPARTPAWAEAPLFQHPTLNRAIILKHRLRRNESDVFGMMSRRLTTKIIVPLAPHELKLGGQYFFVDQLGFEAVMRDVFGRSLDHQDIKTLRLLDSLPSLDPFLLREQLRRNGVDPAPCYLSISANDLKKMKAFVQAEITPLVTMSVGADVIAVSEASAKIMATKILSDSSGAQLDALRETLRLERHQYQEGVFCWKGFLYYKWSLETLLAEVYQVADALRTIQPLGLVDGPARTYIDKARDTLRDGIFETCESVRRTLMVYDEAYTALKRGAPTDFRDFLLNAPKLFSRLGEELGVVQHIVSFWNYRFGPRTPRASVEELMDILMDFESGLALGDGERNAA